MTQVSTNNNTSLWWLYFQLQHVLSYRSLNLSFSNWPTNFRYLHLVLTQTYWTALCFPHTGHLHLNHAVLCYDQFLEDKICFLKFLRFINWCFTRNLYQVSEHILYERLPGVLSEFICFSICFIFVPSRFLFLSVEEIQIVFEFVFC